MALAKAKISSGWPLTFLAISNGPLGELGPPELDGGPLGPRIKVFVDHRYDKKVLAQMMKTTFFKY